MSLGSVALAAAAASCVAGLAGGSLDLLDGSGNVLRSVALDAPVAGVASGSIFTASSMPRVASGSGAGAVASARYRTSTLADWKTGATVGLPFSSAQVIVQVVDGPNAGTLTLGANDIVTVLAASLTYVAG